MHCQTHRYHWNRYRLLGVLLLAWLLACSGQWPLAPGGYLDLTLACKSNEECKRFGADTVCTEGKCACPSGLAACGAACVNTDTSAEHCGECDNKCDQGSLCCQGTCCAAGNTCCGDSCVETNSDPENCGACGTKCDANAACCKGKCIKVESNNLSCGGCGIQCPAAIKPIVQSKKQTKDGETMTFTFNDIKPPSSYATLTLQINLYGAYASLQAFARVFINDIEQGVMPGGSQCNQRPVYGHTKRYLLPKRALINGKLVVRVELSEDVIAANCTDPKVDMSLSFGLDQCCGNTCIDVIDNVEHCGQCGNACTTGAVCCNGSCCPTGFNCCKGGCCRTLTRASDDPLFSISAHHSGKNILVASGEGIQGWEFDTGKYTGKLRINLGAAEFDDIASHPIGPPGNKPGDLFLAAVSKKQSQFSMMVGAVDKTVFQIYVTLQAVDTPLQAVAWRADGRYFFLGSASNGAVHFIRADNLSGNSKTWKLQHIGKSLSHTQPIIRLKTSRDGRWLGTVSQDGKSTLFEIGKLPAGNIPTRTIQATAGAKIADIALHPQGKIAAFIGLFESVQLRDKSYVEIRDITLNNYPIIKRLDGVGSANFVSFSPDGTKLAVGTMQGGIQIWDVATKKVLHVFREHNARIIRLLFHPDGKSLVSIALDRGIQIWALP